MSYVGERTYLNQVNSALLSESSIGAGVRRVEALVGNDAFGFLAREHVLLNSLTELIKGSRTEELPERIADLIDRLKSVEKELSTFKSSQALASSAGLLSQKIKLGELEVLAVEVEAGMSSEDLKTISLDLRNRMQNGVVVLISKGEERASLAVAVSAFANTLGIKAGALVKSGSTILGGGGGGKDDFAQGGGTEQVAVATALAEIAKTIGSLAVN